MPHQTGQEDPKTSDDIDRFGSNLQLHPNEL